MANYITRRLPNSTESRYLALSTASDANTTAGANTLLRTTTIATMTSDLTAFGNARQTRQTAKVALNAHTPGKNAAIKALRTKVSKFIQHLNDMIEDESTNFQPSDRGYYFIEENDKAVSDLSSESEVLTWGKNVINGETNRIAAGGTALSQPSLADVSAALTTATTQYTEQQVLASAYNTAQEALQALNTGVDGTIKMIWAEVESASANDPDAGSRREKAAVWGVVYVTVQEKAVNVSVTCIDIESQAPIQQVEVQSPAADLEIFTNLQGIATAKSDHIGPDTITADHPEYEPASKAVTYTAGADLDVVFLMKKKA